ncbi:MAG: O-antigen ligase family protein [Sneathiellaceae bacterium]
MRLLPFIGLLLAIALAPLPLGSNRPGPWSLLAIWIGLMLMAWGFSMWRDWTQLHVRLPYWKPPALAFAAVLAWGLVQAMPWTPGFLHHWMWAGAIDASGGRASGAISAVPLETLTGVTRLATYGGAFFLAMQFCRERANAQRLVTVIILSALAYAVYGLAVNFSGNGSILWYQKWAYPESLTSTFVNRNSFATFCGIAMVTLVASLMSELRGPYAHDRPDDHSRDRRMAKLAVLLAILLVLFTALLLSRSRAGLAASLIGITVVLVLHYRLGARGGGIGLPAGGRLWPLAIGAAMLVILLISGGAVIDRLGEDRGMAAGRAEIWERSVVALADAPLRGHGLGTYESIFFAYQDEPHIFIRQVDKAHDTYLELFVELGLPFGLLLIAVPGWLSWRILRGTAAGLGGRYGTAALGSTAVLGIHSAVDFSAQIPAIALVWVTLLGAGFAQTLPSGVSAMVFVRQSDSLHQGGEGRGERQG